MQVELRPVVMNLLFQLRALYQKSNPTYQSSPTIIINSISEEMLKKLIEEEQKKIK